MRLAGTVQDVKAIEQMIRRRDYEVLHDGGGEGVFAIVMGNNGHKSSVFTRVFKVYLPNNNVQIGLYYDNRNNIGMVRGRDDHILKLFASIKGLNKRCARMKAVHNNNRRNDR